MTTVRSVAHGMLALLLGLCSAVPGRLAAFAEDLCREQGRVVNCVDRDREGWRPPRIVRLRAMVRLWNAAQAKNGRSMIHVDSTYFIALAVGLRPDIAYWIAAYDEVPDAVWYVPFGSDGKLLVGAPHWHTARLNGWHRTARQVAGTVYHFPAPYLPPGVTTLPPSIRAVRPDLQDSLHEGTVVHFRRWALEDRPACTGGFTTRSPEGSYFTGSSCFPSAGDARNLTGKIPILGALLTFVFKTSTGPQIALFDPKEDPDRERSTPASILYAGDLQKLLDASTGRLADGRTPVPAELAKMGIYLHVLQDRISHEGCLDRSYVTGPDPRGRFQYHFDRRECIPPKHAFGHLQEIGWPKLPERTLSALEYTYDELRHFVERIRDRHPEWLSDAPRMDRAQLIRDAQGTPGVLPQALSVKKGCDRLKAMNAAIAAAGYPLMPGNELEAECP